MLLLDFNAGIMTVLVLVLLFTKLECKTMHSTNSYGMMLSRNPAVANHPANASLASMVRHCGWWAGTCVPEFSGAGLPANAMYIQGVLGQATRFLVFLQDIKAEPIWGTGLSDLSDGLVGVRCRTWLMKHNA